MAYSSGYAATPADLSAYSAAGGINPVLLAALDPALAEQRSGSIVSGYQPVALFKSIYNGSFPPVGPNNSGLFLFNYGIPGGEPVLTHWALMNLTNGSKGYFIDSVIEPGFDVSTQLVTAATPYATISCQAALQAAGMLTTAGYFTCARVQRIPRLSTLTFDALPTYAAEGQFESMIAVQEGAKVLCIPEEVNTKIAPIPTSDVTVTTGLISTVAYASEAGWVAGQFSGGEGSFLPPNLFRKWKLSVQGNYPTWNGVVNAKVTLTITNSANPNGLVLVFPINGGTLNGNSFFWEVSSMGYNPQSTTRLWETGVLSNVAVSLDTNFDAPTSFVRIETFEDVEDPYIGPAAIIAYQGISAGQQIGLTATQVVFGVPQTSSLQYIQTFSTKTEFDLDGKIAIEVLNNLRHFGINPAMSLAYWRLNREAIIRLASRDSRRVGGAGFWGDLWGSVKNVAKAGVKQALDYATDPQNVGKLMNTIKPAAMSMLL